MITAILTFIEPFRARKALTNCKYKTGVNTSYAICGSVTIQTCRDEQWTGSALTGIENIIRNTGSASLIVNASWTLWYDWTGCAVSIRYKIG